MTEGPFIACGLSLGGYVALEIAANRSERLVGLCLFNTSARADTEEGRERRLELIRSLEARSMRALTLEYLEHLVHPSRMGEESLTDCILDMAETLGHLETYLNTVAPKIQKKSIIRYGTKLAAFRTVLEEV